MPALPDYPFPNDKTPGWNTHWGSSIEEVYAERLKSPRTLPPEPSDDEVHSAVLASSKGFPITGKVYDPKRSLDGLEAWKVYKPVDEDYDWQIGAVPNGPGLNGKKESVFRIYLTTVDRPAS